MTPPDQKLLDLFACPRTHTRLRFDPAHRMLVSDEARLAYPLRDGIPLLLAEEARQLTPEGEPGRRLDPS